MLTAHPGKSQGRPATNTELTAHTSQRPAQLSPTRAPVPEPPRLTPPPDDPDQTLIGAFSSPYNPHRRHSSLGYVSPIAFERRYQSMQHDAQEGGALSSPQRPSAAVAKALPLPESGPFGPVEADRPALKGGAPAGLETPTAKYDQQAVA